MEEERSRPRPRSHLYPPRAAFLAGVTGGLAAPLVAAGAATIIGSAGAAALGSAAGIAVMTSLFGAAGAGLTGKVPKEWWPRFSPVRAPWETEEEDMAFLTLSPGTARTYSELHRELGGWLGLARDKAEFEKPHLV